LGTGPDAPDPARQRADAVRPAGRSGGGALKRLVKLLLPADVRYWIGVKKEIRRLAALFREQALDVFHSNNTGCEEAPLAARAAGVARVIGTFHVLPSVDVEGLRCRPVHRRLERQSNHALHAAIAVCDAARSAWLERTPMNPGRVLTIHNGIDPARFRRRTPRPLARQRLGIPADGSLLVGGMGRLGPIKGFEYLIDAVARLRAEGRAVRLLLAGDGPLRTSLEELARQTGAAGWVHFVGFQPDPQAVLDALDVFALSSLSEAFPYVILEAMAAELPCVGSDVGGVPELIAAGSTGLLVPPRDRAALASALGRLADSPSLREDMGREARQRVCRHFNEQDMIQRTMQLYEAGPPGACRAAPDQAAARSPRPRTAPTRSPIP
jgi:glycosyltransferase involved in cell wall biosynthesis